MADILSLLSIISFAVAGVCLVISIILWVVFRIPLVIGDLSGRTARKSIARQRKANETSMAKGHQSSKVNAQRGKLTETMSGIKKAEREPNRTISNQRPETGLLKNNMAEGAAAETTGLLVEEDITQPLEQSVVREVQRASGVKMEMIEEIMIIHTQERINLV